MTTEIEKRNGMTEGQKPVYQIRRNSRKWKTVSKNKFVEAEREAGFFNTTGDPSQPGTGGFSAKGPLGFIEGRIK